jgi:hypothetical protein
MALSTEEYIAIMSVLNTKNIAKNAVSSERSNEVTLCFFVLGAKVPLIEEFQVTNFFGLWMSK